MLVGCVTFAIAAVVSENDEVPGLALFCLMPIGFILIVIGLYKVIRRKKTDDQRRV